MRETFACETLPFQKYPLLQLVTSFIILKGTSTTVQSLICGCYEINLPFNKHLTNIYIVYLFTWANEVYFFVV